MDKATFGAGCFWGIEEAFRTAHGVTKTTVGYSGGHTENPTYDDVCSDETGHAEVVQVEYDPKKISYEQLLEIFWNSHDASQINRQGPDVGSQYRSVIFYHTIKQRRQADTAKAVKQTKMQKQIATKILEAMPFYPAEEDHQQHLAKKGLKHCHI